MSSSPDHVAPRQDEGGEDRRIAYSRDSVLCVRAAALEAGRHKLAAGIVACKNEVEAALWCEWDTPGSEQPKTSAGTRSKSKICTRFFSNADCRFGDNCRYLHHEQAAVDKMNSLNLGLGDPAPARALPRPTEPNATVKARLCKNHDTPDGCKWGDKCHFAHGDGELGKPMGPGSSFKTRLCVSFVTASAGSCAFGRRCQFAHGKEELRGPDTEYD